MSNQNTANQPDLFSNPIYHTRYLNKYHQIIINRQQNPLKEQNSLYGEEHHIIPRSLGGSNAKNNLIFVSYREHYILHLLLMKHFKYCYLNSIGNEAQIKDAYMKMTRAFSLMRVGSNTQGQQKQKNISSKIFEMVKQKNMELLFAGGLGYEKLQIMHWYYSEFKCGKDDNQWKQFQKIFDWNKSKKQFTDLANHCGFLVNSTYSMNTIMEMIDYFHNNDCETNPYHYVKFQFNFNFKQEKKKFFDLCNRRNINIKKLFKKPIHLKDVIDLKIQAVELKIIFNFLENQKNIDFGQALLPYHLNINKQNKLEQELQNKYNCYISLIELNNMAFYLKEHEMYENDFGITLTELVKNKNDFKNQEINPLTEQIIINHGFHNSFKKNANNTSYLQHNKTNEIDKEPYHFYLENDNDKQSKTKHQRKARYKELMNMFDFYIKHNCSNDIKNWEKLKIKFNYNYSKKTLVRSFNRYGLIVRQHKNQLSH